MMSVDCSSWSAVTFLDGPEPPKCKLVIESAACSPHGVKLVWLQCCFLKQFKCGKNPTRYMWYSLTQHIGPAGSFWQVRRADASFSPMVLCEPAELFHQQKLQINKFL